MRENATNKFSMYNMVLNLQKLENEIEEGPSAKNSDREWDVGPHYHIQVSTLVVSSDEHDHGIYNNYNLAIGRR